MGYFGAWGFVLPDRGLWQLLSGRTNRQFKLDLLSVALPKTASNPEGPKGRKPKAQAAGLGRTSIIRN